MENQQSNSMQGAYYRDVYEAGKQGIKLQGSFRDEMARDLYEAGKQGIAIKGGVFGDTAPQPSAMETAFSTAKDVAGTVADTAKQEAGVFGGLVSGEGRMEYPDMPEITEANIGFFESFMPNMKLGLTLDPTEKARIIQNEFQSDPRFGGVFADAQGNPIVEWEGQPYYVNKPGASMQDATDVTAQIAQFLPATKAAGAANTFAGRLMSGAATYGATDVAQQAGVRAAGGKDAIDLGQSGATGAIGGAMEAALPPLMKGAGRVARGAVDAGKRVMFPRYNPNAARNATQSGIPMTRGQRSQDMNLIRREEAARQGGYGDTASDVMRGFDERQLGAIRSEAEAMQPGRSGFDTQSPTDIGSTLQSRLIDEAGRRKAAVGEAYTNAARMSQDAPALLTREGVEGLARNLSTVPRDMNIVPELLNEMPNLRIAIKRAQETAALASNPRFKAQNFARIEGSRKALNSLIGSSSNKTEKAALIEMKTRLDKWTDDAITNGLMQGDEQTIEALRNARGLSADYFKNFGKGDKMDPAGTAMVKLLDENAATPLEFVNVLTGAARTQSTARAVGLVKRLKNVFGPDSEEIALLKDAYLMKAFTQVSRGEREVTRGALVKGGRNLIDGDGRQIASELFSPQEINRIRKLVAETAKTITPPDARNPSRSSFAMMQLLRDNNLLSIGGNVTRRIPLVDTVGEGMREAGGAITARNLTSQTERLTSRPLVEAGAAASALTAYSARNRELERRNREIPGPVTMAPQTPRQTLADILSNPQGQQQNMQQGLLSPTEPRGLLADALMRGR